jgi:hypothetical protein
MKASLSDRSPLEISEFLKPLLSPAWAAADLVDTHLHSFRLPFELHRTEIAQRRVPPPGIIEALNVIKHVGFRLGSRAVRFVRRAFSFQRGEEALHRGIVPAVAGSAHATGHAVVGQEPLEGLTGVLAPPIRVMQHGLRFTAPPDRHHKGIGDELRGHRRLHRPADDPAREEIYHCRDVEPPFGGPEVGEIGDPFAIGCCGHECSVEHIRRHSVRRPDTRIRWHSPPSGTGTQRRVSHKPFDSMSAAGDSVGQEIVPDPPGAIGPVAGQEAGSYPAQ